MSDGIKCYKCSHELEFEMGQKIYRQEDCPACKAYLRCCMMCEHFDPHAYNECHEIIAERVVDKEKWNYCEFFTISPKAANKDKERKDNLKKASSLFKD